ncbi:TonB-dependent receptor [uncultured Bacteroides sp.]|uniref:SusC/RagA family TonB-linked outer membrane protein n=1 Tax=uncultured Bacteroides sp. TaxID=162156 RepID=UPI00260ADDC6|nr:TonB-dependent receptor [uncultured Bacteroides sp.]
MKHVRKTALVAGVCLSAIMVGAPQVLMAADNSSVITAQQTKTISGTVLDSSGTPIIGANVLQKGTTNGTITDFDGNFTLSVPSDAVLQISFIGYVSQEVTVGNQKSIQVVLKEDTETLDEVVVVGYGTQKKKLVTGATVQVKGDDLAKLNTTSALSAMQASTPGVQITQSTTQPGGGFKVYIRGIGTTGNSAPLYVIDGVSSDNMDNVNPADIESIDVLKDAASAAIYGARAANGVILVTTKQGKEGKIQFSYDGYLGWSNVYKKPDLLNAQEYMAILDEWNFNTNGSKIDWTTKVPASILDKVKNGWTGTDWWDAYENKDALQQNHSFNLTGGSERSKFSMGVSYTSNEGIMGSPVESNYKRYTGRINSEHVLLKNKDRNIITIGENLSFYYNKLHTLPEGSIYWNSIHDCLVTSPLVPIYNEDGSYYAYNQHKNDGWDSNILSNPLEGLAHGKYNSVNETRNFGFGATAYLIIEPIKNLRYRGQFNVSYSSSSQREYQEPFSCSATSSNTNYQLTQYSDAGSNYSFENTIYYKLPEFIKGNSIDLMVGQSFEGTAWGNHMQATNTVTSADKLSTLTDFDHAWLTNFGSNFGAGAKMASNPWDESYLASFFGRLNWNYKETYMATVTVRADGSSNFARGHRWGTFPSVSAGWVITNEKFMKPVTSVMDFLKFRISWGQNGNCNIDNFQYLSTIAYSTSAYDNAYKFGNSESSTVSPAPLAGAYADILPNEDVTWETSEQLNIGVDARFFNSRLGVVFDWYKKKTKDWLIVAPTLDIYGTGAPYINGGDVENTGFELGFTWNDQIGKDFKYNIGLNIAHNKNKVTRIANAQGIINGPVNLLAQGTDYFYRAEVGKPIGYFYGMKTEGVWQNQQQIEDARAAGKAVLADAQPGDLIWVDNDGDGVIDYSKDRTDIGNPNPDYTLGFNIGASYKGFDFSVTTHGAFGQQIIKSYRSFVDSQWQNYSSEVFERWHGEGTSNKQPRLCAGSHPNNQWISDRYIEDADFLKIQNITIGYDFKHLWKNMPFSQARLYFQAQNVFTFTGYSGSDPEIGSSADTETWASGIDLGLYPSPRTYVVGVSLKF